MEVKFYSYRTAKVGEVALRLPRELMRPVEEMLAKQVGLARRDNHTVYVVGEGREQVALFFTDSRCIIGKTVIERNW